MNVPDKVKEDKAIIKPIHCIDLTDREIVKRMQGGENFFGLTFGAHTREGYDNLKEGWITTPEDIPTDLYMWCKFLSAYGKDCRTVPKITALCFEKTARKDWTFEQRDEELGQYFNKLKHPGFIKEISETLVV